MTILCWLVPIEVQAVPLPQETSATQTTTREAPSNDANVPALRRVKVNFYVNSISNVDNETGTYTLDCYIDFYWYEPELEGKRLEDVDPTTLWGPSIEPVNSQDYKLLLLTYLRSLEPDTNIRANYRLIGRFNNKFDLNKFPFDQQVFTFQIESGEYDSSQLLFDFLGSDALTVYGDRPTVDSVPGAKYLSPDLNLQEWEIDDVQVVQQIRVLPYDKSNWAQFRVDIPVTRLSVSYVWRSLLELFLLQLLFWSVLYLDSQNFHYRLLLIFSLFMVTVMMNFMVLFSQPRTFYLTFLDRYAILSYALGTLLAIIITAIHLLHQRGQNAGALRLNRLARLLYPVLLLVVNGLLFWLVLG